MDRSVSNAELGALLFACLAVIAWSAVDPADRATWWLEALPVLIAIPLMWFTLDRFPLTPLTYRLIFVHCVILLVGAHYTYAQVPLGFWFQDLLDLQRNHYDRLGHIAQGFIPAMLAREILLRTSPLRPGRTGGWLFFLVACVCLAFSAFYEMIEWWVAVIADEEASAFLATQGDIWDTQWDMFLALCGAIAAQLLFSPAQDRMLHQMGMPEE